MGSGPPLPSSPSENHFMANPHTVLILVKRICRCSEHCKNIIPAGQSLHGEVPPWGGAGAPAGGGGDRAARQGKRQSWDRTLRPQGPPLCTSNPW